MKKIALALAVLLLVSLSGCVNEQEKLLYVTVPGQGDQTYRFSEDVRESIKVPCSDPVEIRNRIFLADKINFIFNGSSMTDNGYFAVISTNIVSKIQTYLAYEGKLISNFPVYYYATENNKTVWYDARANEKIWSLGPYLGGNISIWMLGPNTGALDTSVILNKDVIFVQGTSYSNLTKAGDRLVLAIMNLNEI